MSNSTAIILEMVHFLQWLSHFLNPCYFPDLSLYRNRAPQTAILLGHYPKNTSIQTKLKKLKEYNVYVKYRSHKFGKMLVYE